ncbi:MAG TPA: ABC transporter permease [Trebonia sp.]|nr:ABC transporter permease [Trebonia sp.]
MPQVKQQPVVASPPQAERSASWLRSVLSNQQFLLVIALAILVIYFTARDSVFLSSPEIAVLLTNFSTLILLAVGETFVIISGGIDLSVGAVCGVSSVVAAFAMRGMVSSNDNEALVLLVGTLVCAAMGIGIGLINAALMNWARLVPFVATLATLGAGTGMALVLSNGVPIGSDSSALSIGADRAGPFPYMFLVILVVVAVAWLYLHLSRYGRYTYAIGSNAFAARAAGINVRRHLTSVYVLSGLLAGLTGMVFYIRLGAGAPSSGDGFELTAIASVVIGGVSLFGGSGRLTGTILGALILTVVTSGLIISNVSPNWNQVAVAICIAAAASLQALKALATPGRRA